MRQLPGLAVALGLGAVGPMNVVHAEKVPSSWNSNIKVEVLKKGMTGDENKPKAGDLVEVRFKGAYKGNEFDNTYKTEMPYTFRAGVGTVLPGLDETVVNMHVGETLAVSFGGDLGFGQKGRPSAPGKPRIPPNAEIEYEVTLERLPGVGDEFIADTDE
jgi:FKBP-type peptidyl-prolyl cis-trans isomerase